MTQTRICMDNCGFQTVIEAESSDDGKIKLEISSDCEDVQGLSEKLQVVDPMELLGQSIETCQIYLTAGKCLKHLSCILPAAIIRTVEVEAGIALPGEASISTRKT